MRSERILEIVYIVGILQRKSLQMFHWKILYIFLICLSLCILDRWFLRRLYFLCSFLASSFYRFFFAFSKFLLVSFRFDLTTKMLNLNSKNRPLNHARCEKDSFTLQGYMSGFMDNSKRLSRKKSEKNNFRFHWIKSQKMSKLHFIIQK